VSNLKVRRVRFDLAGDDIPFNWQPNKPSFGMVCNVVSFFAPPFENFVVDATREAIPQMTDPAAIEEANLYLRQEAQHSAAHVRHTNALIRRWPGLRETLDEITESYAHLAATKPLDYRLAYTACVEATFTPYFKVFLDHDDLLFETADERVASLFLWHFCEEIEHRSSALIVLNAVRNDYRWRMSCIPSVFKHIGEIVSICSRGFQKHVPAEDGGHYGKLMPQSFTLKGFRDAGKAVKALETPDQNTYAGVPRKELLKMMYGLVRSQIPSHNPEFEDLPEFADRWFRRFDEEPKAAASWYSVGVGNAV
jgi:predicted metal-dependent hydrolase